MPEAKQENPEYNVQFGGRVKRRGMSRCGVGQRGPDFVLFFICLLFMWGRRVGGEIENRNSFALIVECELRNKL